MGALPKCCEYAWAGPEDYRILHSRIRVYRRACPLFFWCCRRIGLVREGLVGRLPLNARTAAGSE